MTTCLECVLAIMLGGSFLIGLCGTAIAKSVTKSRFVDYVVNPLLWLMPATVVFGFVSTTISPTLAVYVVLASQFVSSMMGSWFLYSLR